MDGIRCILATRDELSKYFREPSILDDTQELKSSNTKILFPLPILKCFHLVIMQAFFDQEGRWAEKNNSKFSWQYLREQILNFLYSLLTLRFGSLWFR